MPQRGYVLIFVLWALLTIITPTLVLWSASAKQGSVSQGMRTEFTELKVRRMLDAVDKRNAGNRTEETKPSAPSPAPAPVTVYATT